LGRFVRDVIDAFELDTDRIVVTTLTATVARHTRMPGTTIKRHELRDRATPINKQVRRNSHTGKVFERPIYAAIQAIREQLLYQIATKATRWEADVVNHQQNDVVSICARIAVRRNAPCSSFEPMVRSDSHIYLTQQVQGIVPQAYCHLKAPAYDAQTQSILRIE